MGLQADRLKWLRGIEGELRDRVTEAEGVFLDFSRENLRYGVEFQKGFIFGSRVYVVDFYIASFRCVIEVDGGYHNLADRVLYDRERDGEFRGRGYHVIRFTNDEVLGDIEGVFKRLGFFLKWCSSSNRDRKRGSKGKKRVKKVLMKKKVAPFVVRTILRKKVR